jgi:hypothetical protein
MGQKYRVHRDVIIAQVHSASSVDLHAVSSSAEIERAVEVLDRIKKDGLMAVDE